MDKDKEFEVFITRNVLIDGIRRKTVVSIDAFFGMVYDIDSPRDFYEEGEWHNSLVSAIKVAVKMKSEKIKSLEDQLKKTKALSFNFEA